MKKAIFKECYYIKNGKYQLKVLVYEYKNYTYEVCLGDTQESLWEQHQWEQNRIDKQIEIENKKHVESESAEDSFNFFWDYINEK